jgi:hypothetical protein
MAVERRINDLLSLRRLVMSMGMFANALQGAQSALLQTALVVSGYQIRGGKTYADQMIEDAWGPESRNDQRPPRWSVERTSKKCRLVAHQMIVLQGLSMKTPQFIKGKSTTTRRYACMLSRESQMARWTSQGRLTRSIWMIWLHVGTPSMKP